MIDREQLRRHYASLSDDALREIDPKELTGEARECLTEEMVGRDLFRPSRRLDLEEEPDWSADATTVQTFFSRPGMDSWSPAGEAIDVLTKAGIPCYIASQFVDPSKEPPSGSYTEYRVMVPASRALQAESILDCEITNAEIVDKWRAHFETLSTDELRELDVDALFAGLLDRVERVKNAYAEEIDRREYPEKYSARLSDRS